MAVMPPRTRPSHALGDCSAAAAVSQRATQIEGTVGEHYSDDHPNGGSRPSPLGSEGSSESEYDYHRNDDQYHHMEREEPPQEGRPLIGIGLVFPRQAVPPRPP